MVRDFLQWIAENDVLLTMAIMGGCVSTVIVPKKPIVKELLVNLFVGLFLSLSVYFYFIEEKGITRNKLRSYVAMTSLIAVPIIRLLFYLISNPKEFVALWNSFKLKK